MKELIYPSTYHAMKAGPCRVGVCKHDGKCWLCEEYGTLRRYAAQDVDRIHELRALVEELSDEKRISDAVIKSLRDRKLEMEREIAAKESEVSALRALVGEMADELSKFHAWDETRALVAKAREVIGTISQPDRGARSNAETTEAIDPTHSAVRKG